MAITSLKHRLSLGAALLALTLIAACEERLSPRLGSIGEPPVVVPTGVFGLVEVNDEPLPYITSQAGTRFTLVSGTFALNADSTWLFSTVEVLSSINTGNVIGSSPANFSGTWTVTDSTINMLPENGTITFKGDSLFWIGGPAHAWDDTLKFTLVKR